MLVPEIELDEAHAALHEAAGQQALAAEIVGEGLSDAVQLLGGVGLLGEIDGFGGGALHPERQLVGRDARLKFRAVRMRGEVLLIQLGDQVERIPLRLGGDAFGRCQVQDGIFAAAEDGALIDGRQEAGAIDARARTSWLHPTSRRTPAGSDSPTRDRRRPTSPDSGRPGNCEPELRRYMPGAWSKASP